MWPDCRSLLAVFPVVLDTDASSLLLKKRLPITLATKLIDAQLIITFVTRAGLTKWAELRNWGGSLL